MTLVLVCTISILSFVAALWALGIARQAASAIANARLAIKVIRNSVLDDEAKERQIKDISVRLFASALAILALSGFALVVASTPLVIAHLLGAVSFGESLDFLGRWDVVVVASVLLLAGGILVWNRTHRSR